MPGRVLPGLGPKMRMEIDRQNVTLDDFNIGLLGEIHPQLGREYAVHLDRDQSTRTFASRDVIAPRPGPISRTVHCEMSPSASTIRMGAAVSTRKCWPSLGLARRPAGAAILVTLTSFWPVCRRLHWRVVRACRPAKCTAAAEYAVNSTPYHSVCRRHAGADAHKEPQLCT